MKKVSIINCGVYDATERSKLAMRMVEGKSTFSIRWQNQLTNNQLDTIKCIDILIVELSKENILSFYAFATKPTLKCRPVFTLKEVEFERPEVIVITKNILPEDLPYPMPYHIEFI